MSDQSRDIPWVDSNLFTENFNKFPAEEYIKYAGQYTAWSLDGTQILASASDQIELEKRLTEVGIDPSRVVGMYIPPEDISSVLQ